MGEVPGEVVLQKLSDLLRDSSSFFPGPFLRVPNSKNRLYKNIKLNNYNFKINSDGRSDSVEEPGPKIVFQFKPNFFPRLLPPPSYLR